MRDLVIIKGAGDIASGVAHRLRRCGFPVVMLEVEKPTVIRRTVAFAEAVYEGQFSVEGVAAALVGRADELEKTLRAGKIAVAVDPTWRLVERLAPAAVVDAILAKANLGTRLTDAAIVIGLGPGFTAGRDVHAVVETKRGHSLGRVLFQGSAAPNTGTPGDIEGFTAERVLRATKAGRFDPVRRIGDRILAGDTVARIGDSPVTAKISGVLRGLLSEGLEVHEGLKVGDVDPRGVEEHCFTISDKARAVGGGVLEALLHLSQTGRDSRSVSLLGASRS